MSCLFEIYASVAPRADASPMLHVTKKRQRLFVAAQHLAAIVCHVSPTRSGKTSAIFIFPLRAMPPATFPAGGFAFWAIGARRAAASRPGGATCCEPPHRIAAP